MQRDCRVYLQDILEAIGKIRRFTAGLSPESFSADAKTMDAVIRNLEIVGEAARNVPDDIRSKHPQIEWRRVVALRNILIHRYFGVDTEVIWDIIQNKLPVLENQTKSILEEIDSPG
jgi:uncharacterized protein with HEPN domain